MTAIKQWTTACPNWESLLIAKQSIVPVGALYPEAANASMNVLGQMVLFDVPGKPFFAEMAKPWVVDFCEAFFGAYNPQTGIRHIQEILLLISKKNAKSTLAAGIMLTVLVQNWREGATFYIVAPTKKLAEYSFNQAVGMIRNSPELSALLNVSGHGRVIHHRVTFAKLEILAADSQTVTGSLATGVLIDELHEFGKMAKAEAMMTELKGGLATRSDGFIIYLTTHSEEPPAGIFKMKLDYARKVRDGEVEDPAFLPVLYEWPKWMLDQGLHFKPENWYLTNPNLGSSVREAYLLKEFLAAKESGESAMRNFTSKHLNVEVGMNLRSDRWEGAVYWLKQAIPLTLDDLLDRSELVIVGGDGGGLDDLLGMAVLGRCKVSRDWLLWSHAWCFESVLTNTRKSIASRLLDFQKDGDLTIVANETDDDVLQFGEICAKIQERGLLYAVALDPLMLGGLLEGLLEAGVDESKFIEVKQGFQLSGYIKTTERKLSSGHLWHGGSPMMAWTVSNAKVKVQGNNKVMTKQENGTAKIDPVIALLNAVALMAQNPMPPENLDDVFNGMFMVGV